MRLGVVDVGSNTAHLSIIEGSKGTPPLPAYSTRTRLHLAERINPDGCLPDDAVDDLVQAMLEATETCTEWAVDEQLVTATAVIRHAANRDTILERVRREVGIDLQVLSGDDEARFTYSAARRWFGWSSGPMIVLDIGGGSLEIAAGRDELPSFTTSLALGAGRVTREWLQDGRPSRRQI